MSIPFKIKIQNARYFIFVATNTGGPPMLFWDWRGKKKIKIASWSIIKFPLILKNNQTNFINLCIKNQLLLGPTCHCKSLSSILKFWSQNFPAFKTPKDNALHGPEDKKALPFFRLQNKELYIKKYSCIKHMKLNWIQK